MKIKATVIMLTMIMGVFGLPMGSRNSIVVLQPGEEKYFYQGIPSEKNLEGKSEEEISELYYDIMNRQGDAVFAMEKIGTLFRRDENGEPIYPKEYGGAYIDDYILHIQLTNLMDDTISPYKELAKEYMHAVKFSKVKYSNNDLKLGIEQLTDALSAKMINVLQVCVQVEYNRILIYANSKDIDAISEVINNLQQAPMTAIVKTDYACPETTAILRGGDAIIRTNGGGPFTLGFGGTYNGQRAIITCGHAFSGSGQEYVKKYGASTAFGTRVYYRWPEAYGSSVGDFAIVSVTNNDSSTNKVWNGWETESISSVTGVINYPTSGMVLMRYGKQSCGTGYISMPSVLVHYWNNTRHVSGLLEITKLSAIAQDGDSGGPWVYTNNNQRYLCGIQSGRLIDDINGINLMYATPCSLFTYQGFSPKLTN